MVSTFISLLDIQSWWEIPCIAHFCSLFSSAFDLPDIDIEDLESALLTDGTEDSIGLLPELIVRILRGCDLLKSNRDEITTSNYQMFLRRFLRHQCRENNVKNYFDTDTDFSSLPVRNKLLILHSLCHFRLESADVCYKFNNLEADSLRVEPLGFDSKNSGYWYFFGTRLYREDTKPNSKDTIWQVICFTEEDWQNLAVKLKICKSKKERALLKILEENFLPKLSQLFLEREKLRRKKLFQNRNSARIRAADTKYKDLYEKQDLERIEREKYEEQLKLAEATNKKRRRSQSESTGSGISTYASSIRPSLNSSDFLCKREKFCLSPDLGTSLSPPPASLIHHTPLFPPTPSQSPPPVKSLKTFIDINEVHSEQNIDLEKKSLITPVEDFVIESKIFSQVNKNNSISNLHTRSQRKLSFTPDSYSQLDIKSTNSSNYSDHSDDYDDAISLVSFDEDKENLICYKRSDTESDTESNSYHSNSPSYFNSNNLRTPNTSKLSSDEKLYNMAPITNSAAIKLPGRQTNNSLSSISENIFLPTFDNNVGTKKSVKSGKSGKKDAKETKNKTLKTDIIEKSGKKIKNPPNEKLEKKNEKKETADVDNSHKKKKPKNSDSFTETDEVLQIGMHKVLVYVKNHRDAWPFMDPVEEDIAPRYYSIIRRPMDLLKMEDKLDNGEYKKFSEFRNDFKLIVNNCRLYNGQNNEYTEMVNNLQEAFDKATKKYFDNLSDEEDELGYPDSKLNVFREKYFNKTNTDNDDANENICSSEIINQSKENEQSENYSINTDEDDNKIECKGKTTKRKRKDKDKRRKKKIKLGSEKSVQIDDTEDDEEFENVDNPTLEDEKFIYKNSISDLSEDYEISVKNKNKKSKQLIETEKSKKKSDNKLKERDKSKKPKDEHKSKSKNSEKDKETSGKKHSKKGHIKIKNHKSSKEMLQQSHEESDAEQTDNENIKDVLKGHEKEFDDKNNEDIYDFESNNNSSDEDFDLESKTKNRNEISKKTEKTSKNKKVKETVKKTKEKGKSVKMSTNISESRNKKKNNSKVKKEKVNKKIYSDHITSNSEESELELKVEKTEMDKSKETLYSDSSRSPTPNFKVDLHKKYANTLTPTKSASLERNFSNDDNDHEDEAIGEDVIEKDNEEDKHKLDCDDKKTKKHSKRNDQKRKKDIPKTSIIKIDNSDENDEVEINVNKKKLNSKNKSITQLSVKSKKSISKKSKKKVNKISEAKGLTIKNEEIDDEIIEDTSNLNHSSGAQIETPSSPEINGKHTSLKHKSKNIRHSTKQIIDIKKKKNHKIKSKNKKQVVTETEDNSSDKEDNDQEPEKDMMADIPLFLDKYDLIKQRRRSAALNLKKNDEKNKRTNKQIGKSKSKKNLNKNRTTSIKDKDKNQKLKESIEKLKSKNEKSKERVISIEETQSSKTPSQELRDEKSISEKSRETYPDKSSTKCTERIIKKTLSESGKTKDSKYISTETKDLKNKSSKPKEIKALKKREISDLDIKITENIDEIIPNIIGSPTQNKKLQSKKQQQILESITTSISNTTNLIKKKGKNALGITPPVAIVAPTQSLTNASLIKSESNTNKTTNMEALELETEQTLKDINRWLEHTPRFSEFSSASNSPNRYNLLDDFDAVAAKLDPADFRRPIDTINTGAINGPATSAVKIDVEPKLAETFNDIKKSSDNKLITDLIPVTPACNKLGLLTVKDSDSNSAGTTGTGTTGGANSSPSITSSGGSSLLQINVKPKELSTTQLLPHPPPLPPHIKNQLQKKNKSLKKLTGVNRRKELLGPIDRLQPGKSKGNLLANVHNTNKPEELFPLGAVTKVKEVKNSLVVETDESAPKLSLGSVLNASGFGLGQLHNFGDEIASGEFKIKEAITSDENENNKKDDTIPEKSENDEKKSESTSIEKCVEEMPKEEVNPFQLKKDDIQVKNEVKSEDVKTGSATPNLSAWFKAFGAPKKTKKQEEEDEKKKTESLESGNSIQNTTEGSPTCSNKNAKSPAQTNHENFSLPAPRQRKASTGSTVSERSSYSQDPDSPRIGIDDRFGPYPGPYASPIGASPIMVSPKADEITKPTSPYPLNGTIKVGFYQDTTTKSSPEKSCSPRELPSPAYPQYSQHIYSATSPNVNTSADIVSPGTTPYGAGSSQVNNSLAGGSSTYNANNDQKKTPSSSGFSPRSPVQPPTPTLYEQYKQPHSQESDYNSSMSPSTNPNSPYQQPQSSPYQQQTSSSPYHQSSNPNSPYQQPHSPFSNQQGQSGQGPPSSGPPSVGSMHIVTNSPNHPNGESPRGQHSPYQQQLNSPYQHSGHSSPYNQNQSASSPFHQSSSPAHVSAAGQSQSPLQSNSQKSSSFVQPPIINMETASSVLEKHQLKLQKSENDNGYDAKQNYSDEKSSKPIVDQNSDVLKQTSKSHSSAPPVQQSNLPQGQTNVSQSQQPSVQPQSQLQSLKQTQQHSSQVLQTQQYHSSNQSQILNHTQGPGNSFESNNTLLNNSSLNQGSSQISNLQSNQGADLSSVAVEKTNLNLQPQYSRYPQYPIPANTEKGGDQRTAFVNDLSQQLATKQNPMNMSNTQHQSQKHQAQQQLHQTLQQSMHQNLHQSPQNLLSQQSQQQLQQQSLSMKRNYSNEASSTSMNVNYSQQNVVNDVKNSKADEKVQQHQTQAQPLPLPLQQHQHQPQQQQHQAQQQSQSQQQQPLYDPATLNKHHQMFDGFLNSMAASKNISFNKPLDIASNKAYEVLNKAAAIGFPNHLMQAAAAAVMSNKDSLQQHQTTVSGHSNQQQKTENLTNIYSQTLTQISNTNRMNLPPQSQQHQTQHPQSQQQQHQQTSQAQPQQAAHNQQSTATPLYGGSKNGQGNMSTVNTAYGTQNTNQRNDNPAELMSNSINRNLDLSNYKAPASNYQNSSNVLDHTMRHHSTLTQMIDDSAMLGLQNNAASGIGNIPLSNYYDKSMPPAAHMFSKNLSQQLYQNSSTIYGGRDQQNLPPPGNYVPQNNQNSSSNVSSINSQVEQQISSTTSSVEPKQNKRNKKKKGIEATNLNQNSINMVGNNQHAPSTSIQLPQTQQHQTQEQQQMLSNTQNPSNTSNNNNISPNITAAHQGFQLYAGLKTAAAVVAASSSANQVISSGSNNSSTDSSAISLKTTAAAAAASMVPGSAFNFGPSPTGLPIPGGLYGDNSTYLEEFRTANPYYIPPTHHRVTSESSSNNPIQSSVTDKSQTPSINSNSTPTVAAAAAAAASPYHQFLTAAAAHPAAQRSTYPFMNSPQLDPNSPLYTQYLRTDELRARMMQNLSQSLLPGAAAAAGYPQTGYRPTLGMPKPYDINNRQTWF